MPVVWLLKAGLLQTSATTALTNPQPTTYHTASAADP